MVNAELKFCFNPQRSRWAEKMNEESRNSFYIPDEPNSNKIIRSLNDCVEAINNAQSFITSLKEKFVDENFAKYYLIVPIQNPQMALQIFDLIDENKYKEATELLLKYEYFEIFYVTVDTTESMPYTYIPSRINIPKYESEVLEDTWKQTVFNFTTTYTFSNDFDSYINRLKAKYS